MNPSYYFLTFVCVLFHATRGEGDCGLWHELIDYLFIASLF